MSEPNFIHIPNTKKKPQRSGSPRGMFKLSGFVIALIAIAAIAFSCYVVIPAGHTGVVTTFGKVEDYTFNEGFHLKLPVQEIVLMDNRTQKATIPLMAFSSDIQQVDVECSVNFSIDRETAQNLYSRVGRNYYDTVMKPRILENVKAVFTRYNAEKLMQVRNELSGQIKELLEPEMKPYGIQIVAIAIENVDFTDAFTDAVESKQVAEQTKLKAETEQEQQVNMERSAAERQVIAANAKAQERAILAQADADVKRINADATAYARKVEAEIEAEANNRIAESLTDELIRYRATSTWNGQLPILGSGSGVLPMIDLPVEALMPSSATAATEVTP